MAVPELAPGTMFRVAPGLRTRTDPLGHVLVDSPVGTVIDIGPNGHGILALFAVPAALGDVIARLETDHIGRTGFAPTMSVINMLVEERVLTSPTSAASPTGWADPVEHARMLHDERRTSDFITAVGAAVQPNDRVLEIGTGSGVLAVAAARAGAAQVYAVEATDIAGVAEQVFAANDVDDRVTLVPGWSRDIDLDEPVDLLVAEVIGNEPFEEEILETTLDARRRLLKSGGRLVPHALTVFARPVQLPEAEHRERAFGRGALDRWQQLYDIDFTALLDASNDDPVHTLTEAETVAGWLQMGPPVPLVSIDLTTFEHPSVRASADLVVDSAGPVNGVAITFRADLYDDLSHTVDPWRWPASSWAISVWVLPEPAELDAESVLRVQYHRRVPGASDGLTCQVITSPTGRTPDAPPGSE